MSRLDGFIQRTQAQRDCLNYAVALIADAPGAVLDLSLGNDRLLDHLSEILPDREIFVFDRVVNANPQSTPDDAHMFVGEVLAYSDLGTGTTKDAPLRPLLALGAGWDALLLLDEVPA